MRLTRQVTTTEKVEQKSGEPSYTKETIVQTFEDPVDELAEMLKWAPWNFEQEQIDQVVAFAEKLRKSA